MTERVASYLWSVWSPLNAERVAAESRNSQSGHECSVCPVGHVDVLAPHVVLCWCSGYAYMESILGPAVSSDFCWVRTGLSRVTPRGICRMFLRVCSAHFAVSPEAHFTLGAVSTCEDKQNKKDPEVPCSTFTPTKHCPTSPNYFPRCIHIPRSNWHCETGPSDMFIWMSKYLSKPRHVGMSGRLYRLHRNRANAEHLCLQHRAAEIRSLWHGKQPDTAIDFKMQRLSAQRLVKTMSSSICI